MEAGASKSLPLLSKPESASLAERRSSLEDEVISLFEQLRAPVLRYLLSFRLSVPDAEDVAQDVFLSLFRHLLQNKSRANLQGWVFRVAHNSALKCRLRTKRYTDRFSSVPELSGMTTDPGPGPEEHLADTQQREQLLLSIQALPEQDQWCLSLRAEGLRYREIAEVLGISLGSVAASLEKSLARLTRTGTNLTRTRRMP